MRVPAISPMLAGEKRVFPIAHSSAGEVRPRMQDTSKNPPIPPPETSPQGAPAGLLYPILIGLSRPAQTQHRYCGRNHSDRSLRTHAASAGPTSGRYRRLR
jgi:hypothetical protein